MQEQDGNKKFNISERLEDLRREHEALRWEGSFRDYFELVAQNPRIAQLSHARINDMVHAAGVERINEGTQHEVLAYNFFSSELFGIEEPNLFGRGKRIRFQWQFGRNVNDFTLSYTDPAIRDSRISGTVTLFNSRQRFVVGDLGRRRQEGGSIQLGFPFLGSRFTRIFASYGFQRIKFTEGSEDLRERFNCNNCSRSTLGTTVLRDTRIGLPFATAGSMTTVQGEVNGGILGGTGRYQKLEMEGRWYAPLGALGGNPQLGSGVQLVLGFTAKSGFVFGDAGPFFTELYSMGGTQFGTPLRGYDEFSITPDGFDPSASTGQARPGAFGKAFAAFTVEFGARISQSVYLSTFMDASLR